MKTTIISRISTDFLMSAFVHRNRFMLIFFITMCVSFGSVAKTTAYDNRFKTGARYLEIQTIEYSIEQENIAIELEISWDGSWKDSETHDAAWVFIKGKNAQNEWSHMQIISAETIDNNSVSAEISIPDDNMGFFISRKEQGQGDNLWGIKVSVKNDNGITLIKPFGLEMVLIPEGPFELGTVKGLHARNRNGVPESGGAPYNPFFKFRNDAKDDFDGPYLVDSEKEIPIGPEDGFLFYEDSIIPSVNTFSGDGKGILKDSFPKGFASFYLMKYELTQGQYADFLNTLSPEQASRRSSVGAKEFGRPKEDYRNTLVLKNGVFSSNRPKRAANFLSWRDGLAYADWSGLRPMTELEFEKAARGPMPATYLEFVFGINELGENKKNIVFDEFLMSSTNEEDGTEQIDGNFHTTMMKYIDAEDVCPGEPNYIACRSLRGGDGSVGPLRVGIHGAKSNANRITSGASYYGVMELSGNLQEPVVSVGHPNSRMFNGQHGDGLLTDDAEANTESWFPEKGPVVFGGRGGSWPYSWNHARISDRFKAYRDKPDRRASHIGWRGARSLNL